ncbi:ubiquitin-related domain-containing protein [Suillus subalutaceus]|uniref:ubiquitin-related domain-containing protein n=1 Tax=Suillus subalutaceus TaxID=48586 RepID=UPI001B87FA66|nr:ubiquitin-related domain-containing protein [Suillus subalutaceus]KAG1863525.1 ubiquitin-related domain-containing protein [Suillus subalutaceus]
MAGDKETLLSMGFDPARVDWALRATNNRGLQPAMDHILENEGKPIPDPSAAPTSASGSTGQPMDVDVDDEDEDALRHLMGTKARATSSTEAEAKSIKCSECGKVFKTTALANYHAEKSGHDQFEESTEEIKPLTEEEKQQKLAELREKIAAKRSVKTQQEAAEARANEAIRRKTGKDVGKLKDELMAKELVKEAEQKRREKLEDAKAKAAVKAQIEADKKARAERTAREKALRDGQPIIDAPAGASTTPAVTASSSSGTSGKDFKETRLQIRMATGGTPYTTTLSSDATLREVAEFLAAQTLAVDVETVAFAQHFPRKTFSRDQFSKTLRELGLTPSAVLIAS